EKFIAEREDFGQQLRQICFMRVMPSQANYFLCEILPPYTSFELVLKLLRKYNILTRNCSKKSGLESGQYMRLAVRSHSDNTRLIAALREIGKAGK
ncbi:MAG: aminotransferase, partial [Bacteroidaceae bacterium]|nr:aminotransferase [Bacteroidaceae bacterium]